MFLGIVIYLQGSQLLPQLSPGGGLTGLVMLNAALRRLVSREGAGRAFKRRVRVGECFFASVVLGGIFLVRKTDKENWYDRGSSGMK